MSLKPAIALTTEYKDNLCVINRAYIEALESAGALPVLLPYTERWEDFERYADSMDGILFTGGGDIDPARYGEEILNDTVSIDESRDKFEFSLFLAAKKRKLPVMAICRGMQVVNVALGGSLYQDLPTQRAGKIYHRQSEGIFEPSHSVKVLPHSPLHTLTATERITANSFHHQAVKELGDGLVPMAYSDDGIIEAFFAEGEQYIMAYQWHPERLLAADKHNEMLFTDFVREVICFKNGK